MYERFTDRARKVLQLANQEAQSFKHEYIGTEHILLGLVKEGSGVAANVLKNLDIDLRKIRLEVEKIIQSGPEIVTADQLAQTQRAKKVIEYAIEEARNLNHNYIGTEHLLLGILREEEGVAAQVLMNLGLKLKDVRDELLGILGIVPPKSEAPKGESSTHVEKGQDDLAERIEQLEQEKEAAVAEQDFEKAANLRDQIDKLKKRRESSLRQTQSGERKLVFEYELIIPCQCKDGRSIEKEKIDLVKKRLHDRFEGFVYKKQRITGTWIVGNAEFQSAIVTFRVIAEEDEQPRDFFMSLKAELLKDLKLGNVAIIERKVNIL